MLLDYCMVKHNNHETADRDKSEGTKITQPPCMTVKMATMPIALCTMVRERSRSLFQIP